MSWRKICKLVFVTVLFGAAFAVAAETADSSAVKKDSVAVADSTGLKTSREGVFSIAALLLPHNSLRNSETLHNWPFFAFAVPAYTYHFKVQQDFGKLLSFKGLAAGDVNFAGVGLKLDAAIELIHLLELGAEANTGTALNYGETATFMGVYDTEKRNYRQDAMFTQYAGAFGTVPAVYHEQCCGKKQGCFEHCHIHGLFLGFLSFLSFFRLINAGV